MVKDKIPGWFWLIAGIAMAIYAQVILTRTQSTTAMKLFFYVGLLFIVIGIFQLVVKTILNKSPSKKIEKKLNNNRVEKKVKSNVKETKFVIFHCPRCGAKNYNTFNYCQNCGYKLN